MFYAGGRFWFCFGIGPKTQAVRDYLKTHPKAMSGEIAAALNKQRIKITSSHVANIKTKINKARTAKKTAKQQAAVEVAAPAAVKKPMKAGNTVTLEQVKAVALMIKTLGGFAHVNEILGLIKEVGGVKKFKDLLEAMSVPEAS
jgi:arginine repressor